jgi:hypothetical protein
MTMIMHQFVGCHDCSLENQLSIDNKISMGIIENFKNNGFYHTY